MPDDPRTAVAHAAAQEWANDAWHLYHESIKAGGSEWTAFTSALEIARGWGVAAERARIVAWLRSPKAFRAIAARNVGAATNRTHLSLAADELEAQRD